MARIRKRACLQHGPFLDLAWLFRSNFIARLGYTPERPVIWSLQNHGVIASGTISADLDGATGWLKISLGQLPQQIELMSQPRNFGGRQWYFVCPATGRPVTVLWKPPGAIQFASRHAWPKKVAYLSQFGGWIDRAHLGKARLRARIGDSASAQKYCLPNRPPRMRHQTYDRLVARFDKYQAQLDSGLASLVAKWPAS